MKNTLWRLPGLIVLLVASGIPLIAQTTTAHLTLPVTGNNGFTGTATINKFVNQGSQISAIGIVKNSAGTAFASVSWQVTLTASSGALTGTAGHPLATPQFTRIAWSQTGQNGARLVPVQATSCGALNISLGATTINLAGASVTLNPITLDVSGQSGTPVGGLVCSILNIVGSAGGLVNSVGTVVNLLNSLLGSLTGALGGVTGGLGGVTGGA